ncbi:hypothetical protein, conserved [Trypanosoma brucei gambiense DAL972]|uniref:B30.2/SPRY domain-containing protein n=1 Tax=Trypanosoma brucei gambiense (strain MHOM/CI/86/DAL972) TaxID=679716 RepID=C9ZLM1_TRYB9|nr:hypothetical protein, conserved [Trypanosoma brucei gambiense DAL972]CBH10296.1 hypothetical protein, conserved [Trypanosoma brucei gambiense DAL972]|eukprot:XP_011772586.1 hypothetical protein, conserved [Trypanosoma brucei gambiense DAL972]
MAQSEMAAGGTNHRLVASVEGPFALAVPTSLTDIPPEVLLSEAHVRELPAAQEDSVSTDSYSSVPHHQQMLPETTRAPPRRRRALRPSISREENDERNIKHTVVVPEMYRFSKRQVHGNVWDINSELDPCENINVYPERGISLSLDNLVRYSPADLFSRAWPLVPAPVKGASFAPFAQLPELPDILNVHHPDTEEVARFIRFTAVEFARRQRTLSPLFLRCLLVKAAASSETTQAELVSLTGGTCFDEPVRSAWEDENSCDDDGDDIEDDQSVSRSGVPVSDVDTVSSFDWAIAVVSDSLHPRVPMQVVRMLHKVIDRCGINSTNETLRSWGMRRVFRILLQQVEQESCSFSEGGGDSRWLFGAIELLFKLVLASKDIDSLLSIFRWVYRHPDLAERVTLKGIRPWITSIETYARPRMRVLFPTSWVKCHDVSLAHSLGMEISRSVIGACVVSRNGELHGVVLTTRGIYKVLLVPPYNLVCKNENISLTGCRGVFLENNQIAVQSKTVGVVTFYDAETLQVRRVLEACKTNGNSGVYVYSGMDRFVIPHFHPNKSAPFYAKFSASMSVHGTVGPPTLLIPPEAESLSVQFFLCPVRAEQCTSMGLVHVRCFNKEWLSVKVAINSKTSLLSICFGHDEDLRVEVHEPLRSEWALWSATLQNTNGVFTWNVYKDAVMIKSCAVRCKVANLSTSTTGSVDLLRGSFSGFISNIQIWHRAQCINDMLTSAKGRLSPASQCGLLCSFKMNEGSGCCLRSSDGAITWKGVISWGPPPKVPFGCDVTEKEAIPYTPLGDYYVVTNTFETAIVEDGFCTWMDANGRILEQCTADVHPKELYFLCGFTSRMYSVICDVSSGLSLRWVDTQAPPAMHVRELESMRDEETVSEKFLEFEGDKGIVTPFSLSNLILHRLNAVLVAEGRCCGGTQYTPQFFSWNSTSLRTVSRLIDISQDLILRVKQPLGRNSSSLLLLCVCGRLLTQQLTWIKRGCPPHLVAIIVDMFETLSRLEPEDRGILMETQFVFKELHRVLVMECVSYDYLLERILSTERLTDIKDLLVSDYIPSLVTSVLEKDLKKPFMAFLNRLKEACLAESQLILTGKGASFRPSCVLLPTLLSILSRKANPQWHLVAIALLNSLCKGTMRLFNGLFSNVASGHTGGTEELNLLKQTAIGVVVFPVVHYLVDLLLDSSIARDVLTLLNETRNVLYPYADILPAQYVNHNLTETHRIFVPAACTHTTSLDLRYARSIEVLHEHPTTRETNKVRVALVTNEGRRTFVTMRDEHLTIECGGRVEVTVTNTKKEESLITVNARVMLQTELSYWISDICLALGQAILHNTQQLLLKGLPDTVVFPQNSIFRGGLSEEVLKKHNVPGMSDEVLLDKEDQKGLTDLFEGFGDLLSQWQELYRKKHVPYQDRLEYVMRAFCAAHAWHLRRTKNVSLLKHVEKSLDFMRKKSYLILEALQQGDEKAMLDRARFLLDTLNPRDRLESAMAEQQQTEEPVTRVSSPTSVHSVANVRTTLSKSAHVSHERTESWNVSALGRFTSSLSDLSKHCYEEVGSMNRPRIPLLTSDAISELVATNTESISTLVFKFLLNGYNGVTNEDLVRALVEKARYASNNKAVLRLQEKLLSSHQLDEDMSWLIVNSHLFYREFIRSRRREYSNEASNNVRTNSGYSEATLEDLTEVHYIEPIIGCGFQRELELQRATCSFFHCVIHRNFSRIVEAKLQCEASRGMEALSLCAVLCHPWDSVDLSAINPSKVFRVLKTYILAPIADTVVTPLNGSSTDIAWHRFLQDRGLFNLLYRSVIVPNSLQPAADGATVVEGDTLGVHVEGADICFLARNQWRAFKAEEAFDMSPAQRDCYAALAGGCVLADMAEVLYFEITLELALNEEVFVCIGVTSSSISSCESVGKDCSAAFCSDGTVRYSNANVEFSTPWSVGDVIGCGIMAPSSSLFFTRNGEFLGIATECTFSTIIPFVAVQTDGMLVKLIVNFGENAPFEFDMASLHSSCRTQTVSPVMISDASFIAVHYLVTVCLKNLQRLGQPGFNANGDSICALLEEASVFLRDVVVELVTSLKHLYSDESTHLLKRQRLHIGGVLLTRLFRIVNVVIDSFRCSLVSRSAHLEILRICSITLSEAHDHWVKARAARSLGHMARTLRQDCFAEAVEALRGSMSPDVIVNSLTELARAKIYPECSQRAFIPRWTGGRTRVTGGGAFYGEKPLPARGTHKVGFRIRRQMQMGHGVGASLGGCYYIGLSHGHTPVTTMASLISRDDVYILQDADDGDQVPHLLLRRQTIPRNSQRRVYGCDEVVWVELNADVGEITYYRENMVRIGLAFANIHRVDDLYPFVFHFNEDAVCDIIADPSQVKESCELLLSSLRRGVAVSVLQQLHVTPYFGPAISDWIYSFFVRSSYDLEKCIVALAILGGERSGLFCQHKTHGPVVVDSISESASRAVVYLEADPDGRQFSTDVADLKPSFVMPALFSVSEGESLRCCGWLTSGLRRILFEASAVVPLMNDEKEQRMDIAENFVKTITDAMNMEYTALQIIRHETTNQKGSVTLLRRNAPVSATQSTSSSFRMVNGQQPMSRTPVVIDRRFSTKSLFTPSPSIGVTSAAHYSAVRGNVVLEDVFSFAVSITIAESKGTLMYIGVTAETEEPAEPQAIVRCENIWALCNRDSEGTNNTNCFVEPGMIYSAGQLLFDSDDVVIIKVNRQEGTASFSRVRGGKCVDFGVLFEKIPEEKKLRPFVLTGPDSVVVFSFLDCHTFPARNTYPPSNISALTRSTPPVLCASCGSEMLEAWYEGEGGICLCSECFNSWRYPKCMFHFTDHNDNLTDYLLSQHSPKELVVGSIVGFMETAAFAWMRDKSVNVQIDGSTCIATDGAAFAVLDDFSTYGDSRVDVTVSHVAGVDGFSFGGLHSFDLLWCVNNLLQTSVSIKSNMILISPTVIPNSSKVVVSMLFLDEETEPSPVDASAIFVGVTSEECDYRVMTSAEFERRIAHGNIWGTWSDSKTKAATPRSVYLSVDMTKGSIMLSSSLRGLHLHPTVATCNCPIEEDTNLRVIVFTRTPCQVTSTGGWVSVNDDALDINSSSVAVGLIPSNCIGPDVGIMGCNNLLFDTLSYTMAQCGTAWKVAPRIAEEGTGILFSIGDTITVERVDREVAAYRNGLLIATYTIPPETLLHRRRLVAYLSTRGMTATVVPPLFGKAHLGRVVRTCGSGVGVVKCLCPCQGKREYVVRKRDVRHCALSADAAAIVVGAKVAFKAGSLVQPKRGLVTSIGGNTVNVCDETDKRVCFSLDKNSIYVLDNEGPHKVLQPPYPALKAPDGSVTRVFVVGSTKFRLLRNESYNGIMFDVRAEDSVVLTGLTVLTHASGRHRVEVFFKKGSHQMHERTSGSWTKIFSNFVKMRAGRQFSVTFHGIRIEGGSTFALYINATHNFGVGHYAKEGGCSGAVSSEMDSDGTLTVLMGRTSESSTPFTDVSSNSCGFCGSIVYVRSEETQALAVEETDSVVWREWDERNNDGCSDHLPLVSRPQMSTLSERAEFVVTVFDGPVVLRELLLPVFVQPYVGHTIGPMSFHVSLYCADVNDSTEGVTSRERNWVWVHHEVLLPKECSHRIVMNKLQLKMKRGTYVFSAVCERTMGMVRERGRERIRCFFTCSEQGHCVSNTFFSVRGLVGNILAVPANPMSVSEVLSAISTGGHLSQNNSASYNGIMFDIRSKQDVLLEEIFCISQTTADNINVRVFWKEGSMKGAEKVPSKWKEVATRYLYLADKQTFSPGPLNLQLRANQMYALYVNTTSSCGVRFYNSSDGHVGDVGDEFESDGVLTIYVGKKSEGIVPFLEIPSEPRAFRGRVTYRLIVQRRLLGRNMAVFPAVQGFVITRLLTALVAFASGPFSVTQPFEDTGVIESLGKLVKARPGNVGRQEISEDLLSGVVNGNLTDALGDGVVTLPFGVNGVAYFNSLCKGDLAVIALGSGEFSAGELVRLVSDPDIKSQVAVEVGRGGTPVCVTVPVDCLVPVIECGWCHQPFAVESVCQATGTVHFPALREEEHLISILARYIAQRWNLSFDAGSACASSLVRHTRSTNFAADRIIKARRHDSISGRALDSGSVEYMLSPELLHEDGWNEKCCSFACPFVYNENLAAFVSLLFTPLGDSWGVAFVTDLPLRLSSKSRPKLLQVSLHIVFDDDIEQDVLYEPATYYAAHGGPLHEQLGVFAPSQYCFFVKRRGCDCLRLSICEMTFPPPTPFMSSVSHPWRWAGGYDTVELKPSEACELEGVFSTGAWPVNKPRFWKLGAVSATSANVFFLEVLVQLFRPIFKINWEGSRNSVIHRSFSLARDEELTLAFTADNDFVVYDEDDNVRCHVSYREHVGSSLKGISPNIAVMNVGPHPTSLYLHSPREVIDRGISTRSRSWSEGVVEYTPVWTLCNPSKVVISNKGRTASCNDASGQAVIGSPLPTVGLSGFVVQITRSDRAGGDSLGSGHFAGIVVSTFDQLEPHFVKLREQVDQVWIVQDVLDGDSLPTQERIPPIDSSGNTMFLAGTKLHFLLDRDNGTLSLARNNESPRVVFHNIPSNLSVSPFVRLDHANASATLATFYGGALGAGKFRAPPSVVLASHPITPTILRRIPFRVVVSTYTVLRHVLYSLPSDRVTAIELIWCDHCGNSKLAYRLSNALKQLAEVGAFSREMIRVEDKKLEEFCGQAAVRRVVDALSSPLDKPHVFIPGTADEGDTFIRLPSAYEVIGRVGGSSMVRLLYFDDNTTSKRTLHIFSHDDPEITVTSFNVVTKHPCVMYQEDIMQSLDSSKSFGVITHGWFDGTLNSLDMERFSKQQQKSIVMSLLAALEHWHLHSLIHGNIHPKNVYVKTGRGATVTCAVWNVYTLRRYDHFASPQLQRQGTRDMKGDLWSCAQLLRMFSTFLICEEGFRSAAGMLEKGNMTISYILDQLREFADDAKKSAGEETIFLQTGRQACIPGNSCSGIMFDVIAKRNKVNIVKVYFVSDTTSTATVTLFMRNGTFRGVEEQGGEWQVVMRRDMELARGVEAKVEGFESITISPGEHVAFFLHTTNHSSIMFYTVSEDGRPGLSNVALEDKYIGITAGRVTTCTLPFSSIQKEKQLLHGGITYTIPSQSCGYRSYLCQRVNARDLQFNRPVGGPVTVESLGRGLILCESGEQRLIFLGGTRMEWVQWETVSRVSFDDSPAWRQLEDDLRGVICGRYLSLGSLNPPHMQSSKLQFNRRICNQCAVTDRLTTEGDFFWWVSDPIRTSCIVSVKEISSVQGSSLFVSSSEGTDGEDLSKVESLDGKKHIFIYVDELGRCVTSLEDSGYRIVKKLQDDLSQAALFLVYGPVPTCEDIFPLSVFVNARSYNCDFTQFEDDTAVFSYDTSVPLEHNLLFNGFALKCCAVPHETPKFSVASCVTYRSDVSAVSLPFCDVPQTKEDAERDLSPILERQNHRRRLLLKFQRQQPWVEEEVTFSASPQHVTISNGCVQHVSSIGPQSCTVTKPVIEGLKLHEIELLVCTSVQFPARVTFQHPPTAWFVDVPIPIIPVHGESLILPTSSVKCVRLYIRVIPWAKRALVVVNGETVYEVLQGRDCPADMQLSFTLSAPGTSVKVVHWRVLHKEDSPVQRSAMDTIWTQLMIDRISPNVSQGMGSLGQHSWNTPAIGIQSGGESSLIPQVEEAMVSYAKKLIGTVIMSCNSSDTLKTLQHLLPYTTLRNDLSSLTALVRAEVRRSSFFLLAAAYACLAAPFAAQSAENVEVSVNLIYVSLSLDGVIHLLSTSFGSTLMLLLLRTATAHVRAVRNVALRCVLQLLKMSNCPLPSHEALCASLAPLLAVISSMCQRGKMSCTFVQLGILLVSELLQRYQLERPSLPAPGRQSCVPYAIVICTKLAIEAVTSKPPRPLPEAFTRGQQESHRISFELLTGPTSPEGYCSCYGVFSQTFRCTFGSKKFEVVLNSARCGNVVVGWNMDASLPGSLAAGTSDKDQSSASTLLPSCGYLIKPNGKIHLCLSRKKESQPLQVRAKGGDIVLVTCLYHEQAVIFNLQRESKNETTTRFETFPNEMLALPVFFAERREDATFHGEQLLTEASTGMDVSQLYSRFQEHPHRLDTEVVAQSFEFYAELSLFCQTFSISEKLLVSPNGDASLTVPSHDLVEYTHLLSFLGADVLGNDVPIERLVPYVKRLQIFDTLTAVFSVVVDIRRSTELFEMWKKLKSLCSAESSKKIQNETMRPFRNRTGHKGKVTIHTMHARASVRYGFYPTLMRSVFGQLFAQLQRSPISIFYVSPMFTVKLAGFGSTDVGGPYRDILSQLATEIMSTHPSGKFQQNPLFKDCGCDGQLAVMPNATMALEFQLFPMFEFFGKFLAACFITKDLLAVEFPPLFWKLLLSEETSLRDLRAMDRDIMRQLTPEALAERTAEELEERFPGLQESWLRFCSENSHLRMREELPPVDLRTAGILAEHIASIEVHKYDVVISHIRHGFGQVIPLYTLNAFRWQQVELIICGTPKLSCQALRDVCEVSLPSNDSQMFDEVIETMCDKDRMLLLRFTTGQTRLPLKENIKVKRGGTRDSLPTSNTCFFTLRIPAYSSIDVMRDRILYAIRHCEAIDTDGLAQEHIVLDA